MNKNQENEEQEDQALQAASNLHDLLKVLHELRVHLCNLKQSHHLDHSHNFRNSSQSAEPCYSVHIRVREDKVKRYDRDEIYEKPALQIVHSYILYT